MAEITNELIYEILKSLQDRMGSFEKKIDEVKGELQALRIHFIAIQQDTQNIYVTPTRYESRLDRIVPRLEISEVPG
jgi:chromosome segregation ATPase